MEFKIEPDKGQGPRRSIVKVERIPLTKTGNIVTFDCGHVVQIFGRIHRHCTYICQECRGEKGATFGKGGNPA